MQTEIVLRLLLSGKLKINNKLERHIMMLRKAFGFIVLFMLLLVPIVYAEETAYLEETEIEDHETMQTTLSDELEISALSSDELLFLRRNIDNELSKRGYSLRVDLERGDKGDAVTELQLRLEELGYFDGKITGKYDTSTQKALKRFEKMNGLNSDGNASREDQQLLFSNEAIPLGNTESNQEITEKKSLSETQNSKYSEYDSLDYVDVMRNPEEYQEKKVSIFGRVLQVIGSRNSNLSLRVGSSGYNDAVYVTVSFDPGYNFIDGDLIKVYGILKGTKTYSAILGNSITIPLVDAIDIELK